MDTFVLLTLMSKPDPRFPGMRYRNGRPIVKIGAPKKPKSNWHKRAAETTRLRIEAKYARGESYLKLTEREKQALYAIRDFQLTKRYSPGQAYLSYLFGYGEARAGHIINSLVKKGYLEVQWVRITQNFKRKFILFPKGMNFPWHDWAQFPTDIFDPRPPSGQES